MNKIIISAIAMMLPATAVFAVVPHEDTNPAAASAQASFSAMQSNLFTRHMPLRAVTPLAGDENLNSFFEGFEGRDPAAFGNVANRWLPEGWKEFSLKGNTHVGNDEPRWDLTWLTLSTESCGSIPAQFATTAYEGDCYAYIMCDVMWAEKEGPNLEQDEWLVTPTITPAAQEWLYFKLQYRPGWCLYNRETGDFTGENNLMEVYVTEGEGNADSEWTRIWSLKDHILANYTNLDLATDLTSMSSPWTPIFVKISDYVDKNVKFAFRYYGVNGQGMALDNVSIGIPMPKPSYNLPAGFLRQQSLTPTMDEIVEPARILIPFDTEASWENTSTDILTNEWTYQDADGNPLVSTETTLITPAYTLGHTYDTPTLTGIFETRRASYQSRYTTMQAGGRLSGKGVHGYDGPMGVAHYDYLDPEGTLAQNSTSLALYSETDEAWETLLGRLPGTLDILGMGCLYPAPLTPYGVDYVDVLAQVIGGQSDGSLSEETIFAVVIYRLPEDEYADYATIIGQGMLTGAEINAMEAVEQGNYKNLRFNMEVPAYIDGNILVQISPIRLGEGDKIVLPYMKSTSDKVVGNSVVYMMVYGDEEAGGTYDTFYNLSYMPMSSGHFAGFLMSLGATYSYMQAEGDHSTVIEVPYSGGTYQLDIRAMYDPSTWAVSANGFSRAEWISLDAQADAAESDLYHTTLTFAPNKESDPRESEVVIAQPGGRVKLNVVQSGDPASIADVAADAKAQVRVEEGRIIIEGAQGVAELYDIAGVKVASTNVNGSGQIATGNVAKGVYIVKVNSSATKVVVK